MMNVMTELPNNIENILLYTEDMCLKKGICYNCGETLTIVELNKDTFYLYCSHCDKIIDDNRRL